MPKFTYEDDLDGLEHCLASSGQIAQGLPSTEMGLKNLVTEFRDSHDLLEQTGLLVHGHLEPISAKDHRGLKGGLV